MQKPPSNLPPISRLCYIFTQSASRQCHSHKTHTTQQLPSLEPAYCRVIQWWVVGSIIHQAHLGSPLPLPPLPFQLRTLPHLDPFCVSVCSIGWMWNFKLCSEISHDLYNICALILLCLGKFFSLLKQTASTDEGWNCIQKHLLSSSSQSRPSSVF